MRTLARALHETTAPVDLPNTLIGLHAQDLFGVPDMSEVPHSMLACS